MLSCPPFPVRDGTVAPVGPRKPVEPCHNGASPAGVHVGASHDLRLMEWMAPFVGDVLGTQYGTFRCRKREPSLHHWRLHGTVSTGRFRDPSARRYGIWMVRVFFVLRHREEQSGTGQSGPAMRRRLATIPAVCRSGSLNNTLTGKQNRIAAVQKTGGVPPDPHAARARSSPCPTGSEETRAS